KADLFSSIHTNANRVRGMNGFEVYYVSPSVNDSQRALYSAQNASLNLQNALFSSPSVNLKAILWDMVYTASRAESIELAHSICKSINKNLDVEVLGVKGARYFVLKGARIPAVLVEVGFVSNSTEERFLKNYYYREKIADSIHEGVLNYARESGMMQAKK
ncbi:MAG: N-acetylmuramoyl-L-alanine amidase, partial [Candidatus Omnitrophica bacterium]|nr:N-acetylmuramoyl-L-alanine amidase [Candidatus Omnitrophota bacterium]